MTMNKYIYMFAAAGLVLAGCSENDVRNDIDTEKAIDFVANASKTTKAEITNEDELATAGGFVVWGYKAKTAATMDWTDGLVTVFNKQNVTPKASNEGSYIAPDEETKVDNTAWTYSPKKYWDVNATYAFYAIAPLQPTDVTYSITGDNAGAKMIKIEGATGNISTSAVDYLIDRNGNIGRKGSEDAWKNVDFTFNHIMAKLGFKVQRQAGVTATITVTEMKMTGWNSNAGTFTQSANATPNTIECSEWEQSDGTAGSATLVGEGKTQTSVVLSTDNASELTDKYIMVPQAITYSKPDAGVETGLTFSLKYTLSYTADQHNGTAYSEDFEVEGVIPSTQTWGTDSYTIYTVKVGPKPIEFDVESIVDWTNKPTLDPTTTIQ